MTESKRPSKKRRTSAPARPPVEERAPLETLPEGEEIEKEERGSQPRGSSSRQQNSSSRSPANPLDAYLIQMHFDGQRGMYVGSIAEIPELRVEGESQEEVVTTLNRDLEDYAIDREHEGRPLPAPLSRKKYPAKLNVTVSPDLYRRLELRSLQEKIELDRLAAEILAEGLQKRGGDSRGNRSQHSQNAAGGGHRENRGGGNHNSNRRGGHNHPNRNHGGKKRGFDYHGTMESRENFMDYVRKLEKGQRK